GHFNWGSTILRMICQFEAPSTSAAKKWVDGMDWMAELNRIMPMDAPTKPFNAMINSHGWAYIQFCGSTPRGASHWLRMPYGASAAAHFIMITYTTEGVIRGNSHKARNT